VAGGTGPGVAAAPSGGALLAALLPPQVSVAEAVGDSTTGTDVLFPEEAAMVATAVPRRQREYATGRRCARQALAALGFPPAPVLTGSKREPVWPAGAVGSITHCEGYRAAAVARSHEITTVGIDAEPHEPLPDGVLRMVALPAERERLARLGGERPDVCWDRVLFSAKESVYKAWFPIARRWLGFTDADIVLDPAAAGFLATLLVPGPPYGEGVLGSLRGRFAVARGLIVTAVTLAPAEQPGRKPSDCAG
jgi:4'-phosphopantetheinyl transferase EntD